MGAKLRRDREKEGKSPKVIDEEVHASISRFSQAPVIIVVNATMSGMDVYPDHRRQQIERVMAIQSVAAAIQNMLLAAHAEGLGACWFCAPLFCQKEVRKVLSLSDELHPQAIITLGIPVETPEPPERLGLEAAVEFWEKQVR
jgi:nitroreductase